MIWYRDEGIVKQTILKGVVQHAEWNSNSDGWAISGWREECLLTESDFQRVQLSEIPVQKSAFKTWVSFVVKQRSVHQIYLPVNDESLPNEPELLCTLVRNSTCGFKVSTTKWNSCTTVGQFRTVLLVGDENSDNEQNSDEPEQNDAVLVNTPPSILIQDHLNFRGTETVFVFQVLS